MAAVLPVSLLKVAVGEARREEAAELTHQTAARSQRELRREANEVLGAGRIALRCVGR